MIDVSVIADEVKIGATQYEHPTARRDANGTVTFRGAHFQVSITADTWQAMLEGMVSH